MSLSQTAGQCIVLDAHAHACGANSLFPDSFYCLRHDAECDAGCGSHVIRTCQAISGNSVCKAMYCGDHKCPDH